MEPFIAEDEAGDRDRFAAFVANGDGDDRVITCISREVAADISAANVTKALDMLAVDSDGLQVSTAWITCRR
ncbi:hypothetical protein RCCGEPOP_19478 [Rhizobium sp. Pop5]|nr:hypothetical protein RCCGEPOP_19478 [Rhizobium sp. Pop5]